MNAAKAANRKEKLKIISGFSESGLSVKEFCKLHNLAPHIFYYWLKQVSIKKAVLRPKQVSNFVPIKVKEEKQTSPGPVVELVCPNGITLRFYSAVNFSELRALIQ